MITKIFSVYDNAVEAYLPPIMFPTLGAAIRAITDALADPSHQFTRHPHDYVLFELGEFDDSSAAHNMLLAPRNCGVLAEFVQSVQPKAA